MAADLGYIDAANNQFFAEETLVEIIPNFERSELQFLSVADNRLESVLICLPSSYFLRSEFHFLFSNHSLYHRGNSDHLNHLYRLQSHCG